MPYLSSGNAMAWPEILINFFAVWFSADKFDVIKLIQASSEAPFGQNGLIDKQFYVSVINTRIGYNALFYVCVKQKLG